MEKSFMDFLECHGACLPAVKFCNGFNTPQSAWNACKNGDWMDWLLSVCKMWTTVTWTKYEEKVIAARLEEEQGKGIINTECGHSDAPWAKYDHVRDPGSSKLTFLKAVTIRELYPIIPVIPVKDIEPIIK